ncbi:MAG: asparagine synthase (glutamine-hydrolyzing) [Deltaproteobacteria bacterium]|nr:asparagine synthase (glutamine-hydrolyzing) [Deltaproteobacteria bacterium]
MCGIFGYFSPPGGQADASACARATALMAHRGPDADGQWQSADGVVFLGHRRLSIIDLSSAANQPMLSPSGKVLVYNGEIYNFRELRAELESLGQSFSTSSDTEVLLLALEQWGPEALPKLRGMFSLVLWDPATDRALLARDPFGIKPLYLWQGPKGELAAASEIKAFYALPGFTPELDRQTLPEFLRFRSLSGQRTLLKDVSKLPPASYAWHRPGQALKPVCYWEITQNLDPELGCAGLEANTNRFVELFRQTVQAHLIADVPVGTQFSGGVDSSLVSAMARRDLGAALAGFFCRVDDPACDESPYASAIAQALGMRVHQDELTSGVLFSELLDQLTWHQDEPLTHPNSVGIFLLSRLAKGQVKVLLSGETADEIFAGYDAHRRLLAFARLAGVPRAFLAPAQTVCGLSSRLRSVALLLAEYRGQDLDTLTLTRRQHLDGPSLEALLGQGASEASLASRRAELARHTGADPLTRFQLYDLAVYLPPIMERQDKMSMAASIETRVPFADVQVGRFALSLPPEQRATVKRGKVILKEALTRYVPPSMVDRRKAGFGIPLAAWLDSPGGRQRRKALAGSRSALAPYLNRAALRPLLEGPRDAAQADALWSLIALEAWGRLFLSREAVLAAPRAVEL